MRKRRNKKKKSDKKKIYLREEKKEWSLEISQTFSGKCAIQRIKMGDETSKIIGHFGLWQIKSKIFFPHCYSKIKILPFWAIIKILNVKKPSH